MNQNPIDDHMEIEAEREIRSKSFRDTSTSDPKGESKKGKNRKKDFLLFKFQRKFNLQNSPKDSKGARIRCQDFPSEGQRKQQH